MLRKSFLVCVILSLALVSCGGGVPKTVKIAAFLPLAETEAIKLALKEANGKAGNVTVELLDLTIGLTTEAVNLPEEEKKAAPKAIADQAIVGYIGAIRTDQAKVVMPLLNEAGLTQITPYAGWPGLTKPGYGPGEPGVYYPAERRHFFRLVVTDEIQGEAAARWAKQLGFQTVYIIDDSSSYGRGIAGIFELTAKDLGLKIIEHTSFDISQGAEKLKSVVARAVEAKPDLIYCGAGWAPAGPDLVKAIRGADPNVKMMGPAGLATARLIAGAGAELIQGMYGTLNSIPTSRLTSPEAAAFAASYKAITSTAPSPAIANSYEATKVLLRAIERAKEPTRKGVLDAMWQLGEYSGVLGAWRFDERGDISIKRVSAVQVQGKEWVFVQILE